MTLHSVAAFKRTVGALPATAIVQQWGSHVAKVGGKVFALIGESGTPIVFKVSEISFDGLTTLEGVARREQVENTRLLPHPHAHPDEGDSA